MPDYSLNPMAMDNDFAYRTQIKQLETEVARLRAGIKEYACTGTDHPCGCYDQFLSEKAKIEKLQAALTEIAAFDDKLASDHLEKTGSYGAFDEPSSVQIARKALNK